VKAFFDANVLLDVLLGRTPFYTDSARALTLADTGPVEGFASAITFPIIFYIVERARGRAEGQRAVRALAGILSVALCDGQVISQAIGCDAADFEDAVQYFSALRVGADCIITRDRSGFPADGTIPVLTPTEFLAQFELA
jgi:predicted nucleic acid-binding protein